MERSRVLHILLDAFFHQVEPALNALQTAVEVVEPY
jgi:hypothetical protein